MTYRLILVRHGQSEWNLANRFTGWVDVPLTDKGRSEGEAASQLLKDEGLLPDVVHTSLLKRAIHTVNLILEGIDRDWIPVRRSWRLNERHYGALQGLNKAETVEKHGEDKVLLWRRSFDVPPPALDPSDERHPSHDPRYAGLPPELLPPAECLKDVIDRMLPYWYDAIVPDLRAGQTVLVGAHGNSLRALVKHLEGISDADILKLNIPTGLPRYYELNDDFSVKSVRYLGDAAAAAARAEAVANETKKKA